MKMLSEIYHLGIALTKIRNQRLGRLGISLYFNYLKIRLTKYYLKWTHQKRTQEKFLGFTVFFFDYSTFVYLIEEIFVYGTYRFESKNPAPYILDCGSNIGISVLYFKTLFPHARIEAFEPDASTFRVLQKNISGNRLSNVNLHNVALSNANGEITFHSHQSGSLSASVMSARNESADHPVTVPCRSINEFLDHKVDFLKMDIEGAELLCIPESVHSGKIQNVSQMAIECHHNIGKKEPILTTVLSALEGSGFRYQVSSHLNPLTPRTLSQDVMIFAEAGGTP